MAKFVSRVLACVILGLFSLQAIAQVAPRQCGFDRWPVKILNDKDRSRVDFHPVDTTVARLGSIPMHEVPYPHDRRIPPEELHVYRVKARLLKIRHEADSDLHLLLADIDHPDQKMIAEIPAPQCAEGSGHEQQYQTAREVLSSISTHAIIEITGVGFFDFLHEQRGAAKNGIELHPVLSLRVTK